MRTVRPLWELSMVRTRAGFLSQWLHARTGLGSKLENTSFLNSLLMDSRPAVKDSTKSQSDQLFRVAGAGLQNGHGTQNETRACPARVEAGGPLNRHLERLGMLVDLAQVGR
jgi:hypothetical protein